MSSVDVGAIDIGLSLGGDSGGKRTSLQDPPVDAADTGDDASGGDVLLGAVLVAGRGRSEGKSKARIHAREEGEIGLCGVANRLRGWAGPCGCAARE